MHATEHDTIVPIELLIVTATAERTALAEKRRAFDTIVRRYQNLAFACAYASLGDFHLAEDAAQEAFISAGATWTACGSRVPLQAGCVGLYKASVSA